jgi:hypothetical protein
MQISGPRFAGYLAEITPELTFQGCPLPELDLSRQTEKVRLVAQRMSLTSPRVGVGTIAAALVALSMALLGHFVI